MTHFSDRDIAAEVESIVANLQQSEFYVTGVTNLDGTHEKQPIDVPFDVLSKVAQKVLLRAPNASFILIGVGPTQCNVIAVSTRQALDVTEWIYASCGTPSITQKFTDNVLAASVRGEFPIKIKDNIIANACSFLRKKQLLIEEDDDYLPPLDFE